MRKPLAFRIIGLSVIYCLVFFFLVILQFSNNNNFSITTSGMTIKGRYLPNHLIDYSNEMTNPQITGGVKLTYGGLEFNLKDIILTLTGNSDILSSVNPESMIITDNTVHFILPDGTTIFFSSTDSARGPQLQINVDFAENVSEITVPIVPRRSSLVYDNGQVGILAGGSRYFFVNPGNELEERKIVFSRHNPIVLYRYRGRQRVFEPSDYILAESQNYENIIRNWQDTSFTHWNQNITLLNEDEIIAYLSEALGRGNYATSVNAVHNNNFILQNNHRSSVFTGGMINAVNSFVYSENEKINLITRLIRERSLDILIEEHILDYLFSRGNTTLANDTIEIINNLDLQMLTIDHCAGLLEVANDLRLWRPNHNIGHLIEQILLIISDNLIRDNQNNLVFINTSGSNFEYSLRLGKALINQPFIAGNINEQTQVLWVSIGKSLVLSALPNLNSGRVYSILKPTEYYPHATQLTDEHWAWTASPSVNASFINGNMNITFNFPTAMTHYVMIRGVRPFLRIQIHGMDWRSDSQFERYDSSGWIYNPQEMILVVKLRHRTPVDNIRIIYRADPPPPLPIETSVPPETTTYEGVSIE